MISTELKDKLEASGLELHSFNSEMLQEFPFSTEDRDILKNCGLPKNAAPDYIHFRKPEGDQLQTLAEDNLKFKEVKAAEAIIVLAKDSMGNQFWLNTGANHQLTFDDHDYGVKRYINASLTQFLQCIALYNGFLKQLASPNSRFLFTVNEINEKKQALLVQLTTIDATATNNPENYWLKVGFDGVALN
jgi:hypothetical protein